MGILKVKLNEYRRLVDISIDIKLNWHGMKYNYIIDFRAYGFPHFVGLGKYAAIETLKKYNERSISAQSIVKDISKGKITYSSLERTGLWGTQYGIFLKERIDSFSFDKITTLLNRDVIIHFDKSKLGTGFDADLIIYDVADGLYYHLSVFHEDRESPSGKFYASSYFIDNRDTYIRDQNTVSVSQLSIVDKRSNNSIFERSFEITA